MNSSFNDFLGKKILVLCANYFYTGELINIYDHSIVLENASIVYETGPWENKQYKDVQKLGHKVYILISAIESFMEGK